MSRASFGQIVQIGYVVQDLDAAVRRWTEGAGVGPWTVFRNSRLEGYHRGEPTTVVIDVALGYQEGLQIELIELRSTMPSPYARDGRPLAGIHHIAWIVDDLDGAVAAATERGLVPVFTAGNAVVRVAYLESPGEEGVLFELIEGADMHGMIAAGIAATAAWDGSDPVTEIDLSEAGQG